MKKNYPPKFLVIRFRQMGDAVLATSLLNAIKLNFPESETDFVLNERIAPLFATHPAIDHLITFTDKERHSPIIYLRKIWRIMRRGKYDVIIDMRSTVNTLPFALFSPFSRYRIGIKKFYTSLAFNHRFPECAPGMDMVTHDERLLSPLAKEKVLVPVNDISLHVTDDEMNAYRAYLERCGVDLTHPTLLCGVVSKLSYKSWNSDYMMDVLCRVLETFPELQLVFNYAPGEEEAAAQALYRRMGSPENVFINVKAADMRQLVCLASSCNGFFGNEGGARHIAHAVGRPSLVVVSPAVDKTNWLPKNSVFARGISASDVVASEKLSHMSYSEKYSCITPDYVWAQLKEFISRYVMDAQKYVKKHNFWG